jgi:Flp pilus assembly protein TadG
MSGQFLPNQSNPNPAPVKPQDRALLRVFGRDEDGAVLILALVVFWLMAMLGGVAVDLMRYEQRRTEIQQTLDRSVLAATGITQELNAGDVVRDYFDKAGLSHRLTDVSAYEERIQNELTFRNVNASARVTLPVFFMHMINIDEISTTANSGAAQRITNVEVSLVLDISGSMSGRRINNLRPAAKEFVTAVLSSSLPGRVSMSIIPYNAQVNIGRPMMGSFNVPPQHDASSCIELPDTVFGSIDISRATPFQHNAHFDPYNNNISNRNSMYWNCAPEDGNTVTILSDDETVLHDAIDNLTTRGNTSIDLGVKWGAYLLNPNANPVIRDLIAINEVAERYSDRPLDRDTAQVLKVLVVMTDGENTTEYNIRDPYNNGESNIWLWRRTDGERTSVYFDRPNTSDDWYWPRTRSWNAGRDGDNGNYEVLTWPEVWSMFPVQFVARNFYAIPLSQSLGSWTSTFMENATRRKDNRLQQICSAARQEGIVVYGIGFEAPNNGRTQVRNCATSAGHYFNASGLEISSAFRAIASNITQLRLTQ